LEQGARTVLSDVSIRVISNDLQNSKDVPEIAALGPTPSICKIVDPEPRTQDIVGQANIGIRLQRVDLDNGVRTVTMVPVWRSPTGDIAPIESSSFSGQSLSPGSLVCLSADANWFLMWTPLQGNQASSPPLMQRIIWIRTAPRSGKPDGKWHAEAHSPRNPTTSQSLLSLVNQVSPEYGELTAGVQSNERPIRSFRSGDRVGFLLALKSHRTAILWTNTGVSEPDPVSEKLSGGNCKFAPTKRGDPTGDERQLMHCDMGVIEFDGQSHRLEAEYYPDQAKYFAASGPGSSTAQLRCSTPSALCQTELRIKFDPPDSTGSSLRMIVSHLSSTITGAKIVNDFLLVADANGQTWRYSIGSKSIMPLLQARWQGLSPDLVKYSRFSPFCTALKCETIPIPGWPSQPSDLQ
jgi:hypothetical protein